MKTLGVKFSDKTDNQLKELSELLGIPQSKVARAAINIGIDRIKVHQSNDKEKAQHTIAMQDAISRY